MSALIPISMLIGILILIIIVWVVWKIVKCVIVLILIAVVIAALWYLGGLSDLALRIIPEMIPLLM
ncbi:MAG: hypothetical protein ACLFVB_09185 [Thermoplasmata archaeon]